MEIGGAQIVIGMRMVVVMMMVVIMPMVMIGTKQPGTREVHHEAEHGDPDSLGIGNRERTDEPLSRFNRDPDCEDGEDKRAREAGEVAHLAGTECETRVVRMALGKPVGEGRDAQGTCMGRHVDTIGEKRHRSGPQAGDDFDHHHRGGQGNDIARAPLMRVVRGAQEVVTMSERIGAGMVHWSMIRPSKRR